MRELRILIAGVTPPLTQAASHKMKDASNNWIWADPAVRGWCENTPTFPFGAARIVGYQAVDQFGDFFAGNIASEDLTQTSGPSNPLSFPPRPTQNLGNWVDGLSIESNSVTANQYVYTQKISIDDVLGITRQVTLSLSNVNVITISEP